MKFYFIVIIFFKDVVRQISIVNAINMIFWTYVIANVH